jgi:hypothetical protein
MVMTDTHSVDGFTFSRLQSPAGLVRSFCCGGSDGKSCEAAEAAAAATPKAATTATAAVMSSLAAPS